MNISKLVIKGTAKISLHERFTQLSKFQVSSSSEWDPDYVRGSGGGGVTKAGISRYGRGASANYHREPSPEVRMSPALRRPASMPWTPGHRERSVEADRMLYRPSAAVTAAAKIKRKSIHQRLGVRARLSMPAYTPYRPGGGIGARLGVRRWASSDSLADNEGPRRRWSGFNYRRRGGYLNRGNRRFGYGGFRNRNRWGQGRGRGGRFNNRGRGGRGRRQQGPPPSREQLDKEIDSYMAGTKGILDKEIDDYMMEASAV